MGAGSQTISGSAGSIDLAPGPEGQALKITLTTENGKYDRQPGVETGATKL